MAYETILVVDDSPTEVKLMTTPLQGKGYRVLTASDGEQAVEVATREKPRLILLDVVMPNKNGFQVCRQLKTSPDTKDIRIVIVSSKMQETDRFWGMKQGADDYLVKPFSEEQLLAAVVRQL